MVPHNIISSIKVHRGGPAHNLAHHTANEPENLNSSEDFQQTEQPLNAVDEHFASHQDIRSQLNKIMKVGILSHSDDVQEHHHQHPPVIDMTAAAHDDGEDELPVVEDLVRESMEGDLLEMARLEREIEHQKSIDKTPHPVMGPV